MAIETKASRLFEIASVRVRLDHWLALLYDVVEHLGLDLPPIL